MTDNPMESLGGFDMNALLQQAQQLQEQLASAQDRLGEALVHGEVGGGSVTVTVSGVGELREVAIKPGAFDGADEGDLADLSDLIVAAYRDAKSKADDLAAESLGPLAGGLGGMGGLGGDDQPGGTGPAGFGLPPGQG